MFSFFRKKPAAPAAPAPTPDDAPGVEPSDDVASDEPAPSAPMAGDATEAPAAPARRGWLDRLGLRIPGFDAPPAQAPSVGNETQPPATPEDDRSRDDERPQSDDAAASRPVAPTSASVFVGSPATASGDALPEADAEHRVAQARETPVAPPALAPDASPESPAAAWRDEPSRAEPRLEPLAESGPLAAPQGEMPAEPAPARSGWMDRLRAGLRKTGTSLTQVFTGTQIDETLFEELEAALLMADAGLPATEYLLEDLRRRVKASRATDPQAVKALLAEALAELLAPMEGSLVIGETTPTVIMVVGVNGAGKTTSIGKLTRHLADAKCKVLLAAADTFRAAAREQLTVWADRNQVEIVSQEGGDPSAVSFDAVKAGIARKCDVVIADTAGRLPTQLHLMEELKKLRRTIDKAMTGAPHEVLLVVDGNTGQNALAQVKAFDDALGLTGLVVTKLDGTAKGGVLAAIALWARERSRRQPEGRALRVYFVGVGEKLQDLETFDAGEFAQALLE